MVLSFDEYYLIDYRVTKERAQELLRNASVIFLHGGNPSSLNAFLAEYELPVAIKESNAEVIMGGQCWYDEYGHALGLRQVYGKVQQW